MNNWKAWVFDSSNRPFVLSGLLVLFLVLPIALILVNQSQNNRSSAASPDKLETEGGTLSGNAITKADSSASGGNFVELGINQTNSPTPTSGATSCTPVGNSGGATAKATYHSIGLYWTPTGGTNTKTVLVKYRKRGECAWKNGLAMKYNPISGANTTDYRGSIVNLTPNADYEVELTLEGTTTKSTVAIKTWDETPPEGTVTTIPSQSSNYSITGSGTPTAYRVYDGRGATIDVANNSSTGITINASYVIVRNINVKGAQGHGIRINGGKDIIIENCDISGWGQTEGPYGFGQNDNSGVLGAASTLERVTIQRCKIHHPRYDSNSWDEDSGVPSSGSFHPRGPVCINFSDNAGNNVIRYNECYSDSNHMFKDGFTGGTNSGLVGAPGPDSDIYNNYVANVWDDGIATEGGGRNVRVWNNYVENAYVLYANASVTVGPIYLFRNLSGRSDSSNSTTDNSPGFFLKSGYSNNESTMNGQTYLFHNTILQPNNEGAGGIGTAGNANRPIKHLVSRNNILHLRSSTTNCFGVHTYNTDNNYDYDLCNRAFPAGYGTHGISGTPIYSGNPVFNFSTMTGDFRQASNSPAYRKGEIIPNFSEGVNGNPPDIGAQQSNESPMKFGVDSIFTPTN